VTLRDLLADVIARLDRAAVPFMVTGSLASSYHGEPAELLGTSVFIATAEDMVIAKLEWAAASGSDRQLRDVAGILAAAGEAFDSEYVDGWAVALGLSNSTRSVRETMAG
jgi:hypothetical protein